MNADSTIDATWCWDSEAGEELLIDYKTGQVLAKRVNGKIEEYEREERAD